MQTTVCNNTERARLLSAGAIYQTANRAGIVTVGPSVSYTILLRAAGRSRVSKIAEAAQWVGLGASILMGADVIAARAAWRSAVPVVVQTAGHVADRTRAKIPDLSMFRERFLEGEFSVQPGGCIERLMLVEYKVGMQTTVVVDIP